MSRSKSHGIEISSFGKLHDRLTEFRDGWIFRGHSDVSWKLVPKAGRESFKGNDQTLFKAGKLRAIEYLSPRPLSDWDWLAIAQHHGLTTRLLDWTTNPLNAAYFALQGQADRPEEADKPAVIHAAKFETPFGESADNLYSDPMTCRGVSIFRPSGVVPRITRQGGLFTIHGPPSSPMEELPPGVVTLNRIVIGSRYRARLLADLAFYGITSASLFPDLDGLSRFLNWSADSDREILP
jgi:hypothetical protein